MPTWLTRLCLLIAAICVVVACASRDEARRQGGLDSYEDPESHIPVATPGPGWEKVHQRPDSTPTPKPSNPMDKPLDPTGLPNG